MSKELQLRIPASDRKAMAKSNFRTISSYEAYIVKDNNTELTTFLSTVAGGSDATKLDIFGGADTVLGRVFTNLTRLNQMSEADKALHVYAVRDALKKFDRSLNFIEHTMSVVGVPAGYFFAWRFNRLAEKVLNRLSYMTGDFIVQEETPELVKVSIINNPQSGNILPINSRKVYEKAVELLGEVKKLKLSSEESYFVEEAEFSYLPDVIEFCKNERAASSSKGSTFTYSEEADKEITSQLKLIVKGLRKIEKAQAESRLQELKLRTDFLQNKIDPHSNPLLTLESKKEQDEDDEWYESDELIPEPEEAETPFPNGTTDMDDLLDDFFANPTVVAPVMHDDEMIAAVKTGKLNLHLTKMDYLLNYIDGTSGPAFAKLLRSNTSLQLAFERNDLHISHFILHPERSTGVLALSEKEFEKMLTLTIYAVSDEFMLKGRANAIVQKRMREGAAMFDELLNPTPPAPVQMVSPYQQFLDRMKTQREADKPQNAQKDELEELILSVLDAEEVAATSDEINERAFSKLESKRLQKQLKSEWILKNYEHSPKAKNVIAEEIAEATVNAKFAGYVFDEVTKCVATYENAPALKDFVIELENANFLATSLLADLNNAAIAEDAPFSGSWTPLEDYDDNFDFIVEEVTPEQVVEDFSVEQEVKVYDEFLQALAEKTEEILSEQQKERRDKKVAVSNELDKIHELTSRMNKLLEDNAKRKLEIASLSAKKIESKQLELNSTTPSSDDSLNRNLNQIEWMRESIEKNFPLAFTPEFIDRTKNIVNEEVTAHLERTTHYTNNMLLSTILEGKMSCAQCSGNSSGHPLCKACSAKQQEVSYEATGQRIYQRIKAMFA